MVFAAGIATIAFPYGTTTSSPKWNNAADLNSDGRTEIIDVADAAFYIGEIL